MRWLPTGALRPSPDNPRHSVGNVEELKASIASTGILQPLLVSPAHGGEFEIVCGERRWSAAVGLGLEQVPCIVEVLTRDERQVIMLVENLQRSNLSKLEEARGFERLLELGFSQKEIALRIGKSTAHVCRRLRLLTLPAEVQGMVDDSQLSVDKALGYKERDQSAFTTDEQLHRSWIALRQKVLDIGDRELAHCLMGFAAAHSEWLRKRTGRVDAGPRMLARSARAAITL